MENSQLNPLDPFMRMQMDLTNSYTANQQVMQYILNAIKDLQEATGVEPEALIYHPLPDHAQMLPSTPHSPLSPEPTNQAKPHLPSQPTSALLPKPTGQQAPKPAKLDIGKAKKNPSMAGQIEELKAGQEEGQKMLKDLAQRIEYNSRQHSEKMSKDQCIVDDQDAKISSLETRLTQLRKELNTRTQELQGKIDSAAVPEFEIPEEIISALDTLKSDVSSLTDGLQSAKADTSDLKTEIDELTTKLEMGSKTWLTDKSPIIIEINEAISHLQSTTQKYDNRFNELVHVDDFDELNNLVSYIHQKADGLGGNTSSKSGGDDSNQPKPPMMRMGAKDSNKLRDLTQKFEDMELIQNKIMKDLKKLNIGELMDMIKNIHGELATKLGVKFKDEIMGKMAGVLDITAVTQKKVGLMEMLEQERSKSLGVIGDVKEKVRLMEEGNKAFEKQLVELQTKVKEKISQDLFKTATIKAQVANGKMVNPKFGEFKEEILGRISLLTSDMEALKLEMDMKCGSTDLQEARDDIQMQIDGLAGIEDEIKSEKRVNKEAFELIQQQIENLLEIASEKVKKTQEHQDDAMLTKSPIRTLQCASCERDIVNISGQAADFRPWNKLPFRSNHDRLAKYGQGFSKILSNIKPSESPPKYHIKDGSVTQIPHNRKQRNSNSDTEQPNHDLNSLDYSALEPEPIYTEKVNAHKPREKHLTIDLGPDLHHSHHQTTEPQPQYAYQNLQTKSVKTQNQFYINHNHNKFSKQSSMRHLSKNIGVPASTKSLHSQSHAHLPAIKFQKDQDGMNSKRKNKGKAHK